MIRDGMSMKLWRFNCVLLIPAVLFLSATIVTAGSMLSMEEASLIAGRYTRNCIYIEWCDNQKMIGINPPLPLGADCHTCTAHMRRSHCTGPNIDPGCRVSWDEEGCGMEVIGHVVDDPSLGRVCRGYADSEIVDYECPRAYCK